MERPSIFKLIWIAHMIAISIAIAIKNDAAPSSSRCPCRLVAECFDGIPSDSARLSASSACDTPDMIRCCAFSTNRNASVNDTALDTSPGIPEKLTESNDTGSKDAIYHPVAQYSLSMMRELPFRILPPFVNFSYPEYPGTSNAVDLKSAESNDTGEIGMNVLRDLQRTIARVTINQTPFAADTISDDFQEEQLNDTDITTSTLRTTNAMEDLSEGIISPPIGFVYPEYVVPENAEYVRPATNSIDSRPFTRKQEVFPNGDEKYPPHIQRLIDEAMAFENLRTFSKDRPFANSPSNNTENHSTRAFYHLIKRNVSNRQNMDTRSEADGLRSSLNIHSHVLPDASKAPVNANEIKFNPGINKILDGPQSLDVKVRENDTPLNASINNYGAMGESSEFSENIRMDTRYESHQLTVSSSSLKDVTTTPVNFFEQKTASETFLSLDRISTRPIDKNDTQTTTNKPPEAPKNDGDAGDMFAITRRHPSFSQNAIKIKQFARNHDSRHVWKPRGKMYLDRRNSMHVEDLVVNTSTSRTDDPLQGSSTRDNRLTVPITPAISGKDIADENVGKAKSKNSTVQKEDMKLAFDQIDRSNYSIEVEGKDSKNVRKDIVEVTTVSVPVRRFRIPPRVLPTRPTPRKNERSYIIVDNFENAKMRYSDHLRRFYEMKKNYRPNINNGLHTGRTKLISSSASKNPILSAKRNERTIEESTTFKSSELEDHASSTSRNVLRGMFNTSMSNNSLDSNGSNSSGSHKSSLTSNLQDAIHVSGNNRFRLNTLASSQEVEKSMQTEASHASDAEYLTSKNKLNMLEETIKQKVAKDSEQLLESEVNEDHIQKFFNTKLPIDGQSSRNKTQIARPSEPPSLSANTTSVQVSDTSDEAHNRANVASNLDTEKIIEASPRPTMIVNQTEIFDKNNFPSSITIIPKKSDISDETDFKD